MNRMRVWSRMKYRIADVPAGSMLTRFFSALAFKSSIVIAY
ncbi:hypothetical protein [Bradyrhizobium sp. LMG 9283]